MKTLIIYDDKAKIFFNMGGCYESVTGSLHFIETEIEDGKILDYIDVENAKAILKDIPKTQEQINQEQIKSLGESLAQEKFKNMQKDKTIDSLGKEIAQVKLQLIQKSV